MHDLPDGPALLAFARDVLLEELLPLLPPERRLDARLIANCMAVAARETAADAQCEHTIVAALASLYDAASSDPAPSPTLPRKRGREEPSVLLCATDSLPRELGRVRVGLEAHSGDKLRRRFARDLRIGAFDNSEPRAAAARAILWRMTIERLRLANPRFLAANGVADPKG